MISTKYGAPLSRRIRKIHHGKKESPRTTVPIQTSGEVVAERTLLELAIDTETGCCNLLLSDGVMVRVASRIDLRGQSFVPKRFSRSILRAVTLPSSWTPYRSTSDLFGTIQDCLTAHGFSSEVGLRVTYFVFATHFTEFLLFAPCLVIVGPRPQAQLLLQLLGCLARHALPLGQVTHGTLCALPMDLRPTLLVDGTGISKSVMRLLSASNHHATHVVVRDAIVDLYCAKAIYVGNSSGKDDFDAGSLHIDLVPSHRAIPILSLKEQKEISNAIQPKLLAYRCKNFVAARDSHFDLPDFPSELRILARVLGAGIVDAQELQVGLEAVLREDFEQIRSERWVNLPCAVIEAALSFCHEGDDEDVHVGTITKRTATILAARGAPAKLEAKGIGAILRSLGFSPKRNSRGFRIRLDEKARRLVHKLARDFDVAAIQENIALCAHCAAVSTPI